MAELIKAGAELINEGTKTYKGIRHYFQKPGKKHKGWIQAKRPPPSVPTKTTTMMKATSSKDAEVKRVDLRTSGDADKDCVSVGTVAGNQDFSTGWVATNLMQQGVDDYHRIGNKCTVFTTIIQAQFTRVTNDSLVRYMVVYDASPDGVFPVIGDLIKSTDQAGNASTMFHSPNNPHNGDRFRVLRNKIITLTSNNPIRDLKVVVKNRYDCQYDGTANPLTIGSLLKGSVYFIFFYSGATAPKIQNVNIRCKFTDK